MSNIVIVGGGISGLATLHFLKQKFADRSDVAILLLEKNSHAGGTIQSIKQNGYLFETGPNGFLNNKARTLEFFESLGLKEDLIEASLQSKLRYISLKNKLYPIPTNPKAFLSSPLFNPFEKARVLKEIFIPKGNNPQESVFEFGERRLGRKFAEIFLDAMVAGIYGGDARDINLKAAFPRIYDLEQEYGSLFKAMIALKKKKKENTQANKNLGMPSGVLTSFRGGMGQGMEALAKRYKDYILLNQEVTSISFTQNQWKVESAGKEFPADQIFLCCPAHSAAKMLENSQPPMAQLLQKIYYAPIAVVGLGFSLRDFVNTSTMLSVDTESPANSGAECVKRPKGFGFLIPSSEQKEILGVLFDSNIFPGRAGENKILFRIMLGGSRSPDILKKSREELIQIAFKEIQSYFSIRNPPQETFFQTWPKAIPQYDRSYISLQEELEKQLPASPSVRIVANYWKGISLNDCIENAFQAVLALSHNGYNPLDK